MSLPYANLKLSSLDLHWQILVKAVFSFYYLSQNTFVKHEFSCSKCPSLVKCALIIEETRNAHGNISGIQGTSLFKLKTSQDRNHELPLKLASFSFPHFFSPHQLCH